MMREERERRGKRGGGKLINVEDRHRRARWMTGAPLV